MPPGYFPWALSPPPNGTRVCMVGYPQAQVRFIGKKLSAHFSCVLQERTVTSVHEQQHDHGMLNFLFRSLILVIRRARLPLPASKSVSSGLGFSFNPLQRRVP